MFNKRNKDNISVHQKKKISAIIMSSIRPFLVKKLKDKNFDQNLITWVKPYAELNDEKIDLVEYTDDILEYIAAALSPASVLSVETNESLRASRVVVPDNQLSLAIGRSGQNARLAAKLTGWKIDIRPESGFYGEE